MSQASQWWHCHIVCEWGECTFWARSGSSYLGHERVGVMQMTWVTVQRRWVICRVGWWGCFWGRTEWGGHCIFGREGGNRRGGDKLGNGSGCHKTDAADVLTHEIQVKGIRLEVGWHLPGTWQNFGRRWLYQQVPNGTQVRHNIVVLSIHCHVRPHNHDDH